MIEDFVSQGWRNQREELVEVLLNLWRLVNVLQVTQNVVLHFLWKSEGPHGLLDHVELILEGLLAFIDRCHQCSHVTENETRDNGS